MNKFDFFPAHSDSCVFIQKDITFNWVVVYVDDIILCSTTEKGTIIFANNHVFHRLTKHIEIAYHYTRWRVRSGDMRMYYIQTDDNVAKLFRKQVNRYTFKRIILQMEMGNKDKSKTEQ